MDSKWLIKNTLKKIMDSRDGGWDHGFKRIKTHSGVCNL